MHNNEIQEGTLLEKAISELNGYNKDKKVKGELNNRNKKIVDILTFNLNGTIIMTIIKTIL